MKKILNIGFVGLTHLGLNYLAASSEKGFKVVGVDLDENKVDKLKKFDIDYKEPNLKKTILKNKKEIIFSSNLNFLKSCNIVFISQDVFTNSLNKGDFDGLRKLTMQTSKFLNKKAIMVILSQTQPGFTRKINFDGNRLYYQVETLIFGEALKRALNPERIIIGCKSSKSKVNEFFINYLKKFSCPIIKMGYESAELAKISINILLASSITTTNVLARACEKVSADWHEIIPALKLDKRIGKNAYIKPGLGISGGNIERDINSIGEILKKENKTFSIIKVFQKNSLYMKSWVYRVLKKEKILSKKNKFNIGILGLSYKENTNSIKNSPAIYLLKKIRNTKVNVYDPGVILKKIRNCQQADNIRSLVNNSNVIILMTPWPEFGNIKNILRKQKSRKIILIDPYRIIDFEKIKNKHFKYFTIGK